MAAKKKGLGRGLDALLGGSGGGLATPDAPVDSDSPAAAATPDTSNLKELPVDLIRPGQYQPRKDMHPEALEELAESIKAQGVMQPIVVRSVGMQQYEIIAGERRWRATQLAGLDKIPVVIKDVPDEAAIAMALIENIQREDLNPMEEAMALHRLQTEFELTHQEVANAVGKSRTTVTNLLRLMQLQSDVRTLLERGDLEMGHAKALLGLEGGQQSEAAHKVVSQGLSVRQTEELVRKLQAGKKAPKAAEKDSNIKVLEEELAEKVGAPVMIKHGNNGKGTLTFKYASLDELQGILGHIK
jgi:ParB family chromosome partitioning protein